MIAVSTVELSIRMGVALTVILAILTVATTVGKKRLRGRNGARAPIEVLHQQQLSKHTTVALLTAGHRNLLIAVNPQSTTLLAEGADLTPSALSPAALSPAALSPAALSPAAVTDPTVASATAAVAAPARSSQIDIRSRQNPLKQLQNKTVRRA